MSRVLDVEGHRPDPWGLCRVGRTVACGPGGPGEGGLRYSGRGGCPWLAPKGSSPLAELRLPLFGVSHFCPRPRLLAWGWRLLPPCTGLSGISLAVWGLLPWHPAAEPPRVGGQAGRRWGHQPVCWERALGSALGGWGVGGAPRPWAHSLWEAQRADCSLLAGCGGGGAGDQRPLEMGKPPKTLATSSLRTCLPSGAWASGFFESLPPQGNHHPSRQPSLGSWQPLLLLS